MKPFLLLLLILISVPVFSQNYRTVLVDKEVYYGNSPSSIPQSYSVIKPYSYSTNGQNDIVVNHRFGSVSHGASSPIQSYFTAVDTGFMGHHTILMNDGTDIFINRYGDSLLIKTYANLNESWNFCQLQNGDYYTATVTTIDTQTVLGIVDSVKLVSIIGYDNQGNLLNSSNSNFSLEIGKNLGLIQSDINFRDFPLGYHNYFIRGLPHLNVGVKNITLADAYNFDYGDEIHYEGWDSQGRISTSFVYKNKWFSANLDTIYYNAFYKEHRRNDTTFSYYGDTTFAYYIGASYVDSLSLSVDTLQGSIWYLYEKNYAEKTLIKEINYNQYWFHGNNLFGHLVTPISYNKTYIDGLGYEFNGAGFLANYLHLRYYKKGNEEWGNPIDFNYLLLANNEKSFRFNLKIFPNPTNNLLNFQFTKPIQNAEIRIYSSIGQLMTTQNVTDTNMQFQVSDWSKGIYFYGIYVEGKVVKQGQVLIQD